MKMREQYTCPLELAHDMIRGKWKPIILWQLSKADQSLCALKKEIHGVSQKMLVEHLRELVEWGIVDKVRYEGYPLRVTYFLTRRGKKLFDAVAVLQAVGIEVMQEAGQDSVVKQKDLR